MPPEQHTTPPRRPLGELLLAKGLIDRERLEQALAEQSQSGQRLGEILFTNGWVPAVELMGALAEQHGLDVWVDRPGSAQPVEPPQRAHLGWRPLGQLLVGKGLISERQLHEALAEQQQSGQRLGRILVSEGSITKSSLTGALAEQHGLTLEESNLTSPAGSPPAPEQARPPRFEVREQVDQAWKTLGTFDDFLDASDLAFDLLYQRDLEVLQVVRIQGHQPEIMWTYTRTGQKRGLAF